VEPTSSPCIPWDETRAHCVAGLLLGVACCPDGQCALCRRSGVHLRNGRLARAPLDRCPVCGFPPPPPLEEIPPLPRLDRSDNLVGGRHDCLLCGKPLPARRRTYCSFSCWREYVRQQEMVGDDVGSPDPPHVFRVPFGLGS